MLAKNDQGDGTNPRRRTSLGFLLKLGRKLLCPHCKVPCITRRTRYEKNGQKVQYRYCPHCTYSTKTKPKKSNAK